MDHADLSNWMLVVSAQILSAEFSISTCRKAVESTIRLRDEQTLEVQTQMTEQRLRRAHGLDVSTDSP